MFVLCVLYSKDKGKQSGQRSTDKTQRTKKSRWGHGCLSVVSLICCQVEVSATGQSLVQKSPTDCGASFCVIYKPGALGGPGPRWAVAKK